MPATRTHLTKATIRESALKELTWRGCKNQTHESQKS